MYQYDGLSRRIVKSVTATSQTRHFYWTSEWQDIEERVGSATTADTQYVWGVRYMDELVCRDDATPERLYALQDANYNVTAITDTAGNVVERYVLDPYGQRTISDASWTPQSSSSYDWVVGHQGLMQDEESGLIYNRTRYYHPFLASFCQRDAADYIDELSLYAYVRSSPLTNVDPHGYLGIPCGKAEIPCQKPDKGPPGTNGCGSKKWQKILLNNVVPFAKLFDSACNSHDTCYGTCHPTNDNRATKDGCDKQLKVGDKAACDKNFPRNPILKNACYGAAEAFYDAVQSKGDSPEWHLV